MKIKYFKYGYGNAPEINFIGKVWNLRLGFKQIALWKNYESIFNWIGKLPKNYWN